MLRLASEVELIRDTSSGDLWSYLRGRDFSPDFVERIAKVYWRRVCDIIDKISYSHVVTSSGCASHYRLMAHLLREVCNAMTQDGLVSVTGSTGD
jgi:hypothetical protein